MLKNGIFSFQGMSVEKLCTLLRPFVQISEGRWMQKNLSDQELIYQFQNSHEKLLPYIDDENENRLFLACFVNFQGFFKILEKEGPSQYWPLMGLFQIENPSTLMKLVIIRSNWLKTTTWFDFLYEILPGIPQNVSKDILEVIETKNFDFVRCYIKVNISCNLVIDELDSKNFTFLELTYLVRLMLNHNFNDKKYLNELLEQLKQEVMKLTIDSWMELTEKPTKHLNPNIWWHGIDCIPSNYQLLIAHFCHDIAQSLQDSNLELKALLKNFAREYKKEFELDLDNLEYNEIKAKLKQNLKEWEVQAITKHLINIYFKETLQDSECLEFLLMNHPRHLSEHLDILYGSVENKASLKPVLEVSDVESVKQILNKELQGNLKSKHLNTELERELRSYINKAVDGQEPDLLEWYILVFLNPENVVKTLIFEAVNHAGKINIASDLLIQLPLLNKFNIPNQCLEYLENTETSDSATKLIIKICEKNENMSKEFLAKLLNFMTQSEFCLMKSLKVMVDIKSFSKNDLKYDSIISLEAMIDQKKSWTIIDGQLLSMLNSLYTEENSTILNTSILNLPWLKPNEWDAILSDSIIDMLDKTLVILDFLKKKHQIYVLQQLSKLLTNSKSSLENIYSVHEKIIFLINQYPKVESLQNCQIQIFAKILENEPIDFVHLVGALAMMPECDAKKLSLTKLKMMIDLQ